MTQVITKIGKEKYTTISTDGTHEIKGDQPTPNGQDMGPTPYDLLLMALGTCIAQTLRMYADRKGWNLEEVQVILNQDRAHAKDCADCESETGFIQVIEKEIRLIGTLSDEQRTSLIEISDKCPIHKMLINEIKIITK
ncbi:MAG: OsmC family protein [Gelidibacter sp.]